MIALTWTYSLCGAGLWCPGTKGTGWSEDILVDLDPNLSIFLLSLRHFLFWLFSFKRALEKPSNCI